MVAFHVFGWINENLARMQWRSVHDGWIKEVNANCISHELSELSRVE